MKKLFLILFFVICILKIDNCPAQWVQMSNGLPNLNIYDYSNIGMNLFAASWGGVYRTTNSGVNWSVVNGSLNVNCLAIDGNNIYAGTYLLNSGGGIYLSTNNGLNWTAIGLLGQTIYDILINGNIMFAATLASGVMRSTNNGGNWNPVNIGTPPPRAYDIVSNGTNIFAGTTGGVFLSTDNGGNWNSINSGLTNDTVKSLFILNGTHLFAGTHGGVFLSTNNGGIWTAVNTGFTNQIVNSFAAYGTNLFAGTQGGSVGNYFGGVYLSTNYGVNWIDKSNGLSPSQIYTLFIANNYIFAGGGNVFRRDLAEILTGTQNNIKFLPSSFKLHQNYPNPFNPKTLFKYQLPLTSQVLIKIFDVNGREIKTLVNEKSQAGSYEVTFDGSELNSGVYFCRMQAGNFIDTKKLILLK